MYLWKNRYNSSNEFPDSFKKIFFFNWILKKIVTSISIANAHKKDPFDLFV